MVNGGAINSRMGPRVRRGEELVITRTLVRLGIPILRTLSGSALMAGGSFARINPRTAVIGCGIRVNREGARQIGEVLATQGGELIVIDLVGLDLPRFRSGLLRAILAIKETGYGSDTQRRVQA